MKAEQARITAAITAAEAQLAAVDGDYAAAETNLNGALALVRDCEAAYRAAPDKLCRQFNQAFFKRLLIDDNYNVTGELAEPFETLLSDELRQAAAHKASDELREAIDEALKSREDGRARDGVLVLAGVTVAASAPMTTAVQGLNKATMVGVTGLEPVTSWL